MYFRFRLIRIKLATHTHVDKHCKGVTTDIPLKTYLHLKHLDLEDCAYMYVIFTLVSH